MGMELFGGGTTRIQEVVETLVGRMNVQPEVVCVNPMQMALHDAAQTYHQQLVDIGTKGSGSLTNMQRMCLDNIHNVLAMAIQRSAGAVSTSKVMASSGLTCGLELERSDSSRREPVFFDQYTTQIRQKSCVCVSVAHEQQ